MTDIDQSAAAEEQALKAVRAQIDAIDIELLRLINERGRCAIEVGRIKRASGADAMFYRPEREAEVLRRVRDTNPGPLATADSVRLMREVMSACLALEQVLTVAYLGPAGTYTHAAAQKHFGDSASFIPFASIEEIIRQVEDGTAAFAVAPIENSLEGPVNQTHDLLFASSVQVCGEVILPIHHQLLTHATDLRALRRVYAHSQALGQSRRWLDLNCPQADRIALSSNAEAARRVTTETDAAAIAGIAASQLYDLPVRAANIEDQADNTTRFLIVGRDPVAASGDDLTSLAFCTANRAGALCEALQAFSSANISMTRIQSRPLRQGTWEYVFFADIVGHRSDPDVALALRRLTESTSMCRILGSYPRAVI